MKISPHCYLGRSRWLRKYVSAGARWVKITDAPDVAYALAREFPAISVIYRRIDTRQLGDWMSGWPDPVKAGETMAALFGDIAPLPNLYVEGINEPVLNSVAEAEYLGIAEAVRAKALAARGLKSIVGNFATGNPQNLMFVIWLRNYLGNGGTKATPIGIHQYGIVDLDPGADGYNMMGHRRLASEAGALAAGLTWIATETGLDEIHVNGVKCGGGWKTQCNEQQYLAWLLRADAEWAKDSSFLGACLFSFADTDRWKDYEMEDASAANDGLIAAAVVAPKPDCARTDVPDDWTHTVEATLGLRVRSSMSTATLDNVLCSMTNGKQVRSLQRTGDWMRIDWPVSGYCWAPNLKPRPVVTPPQQQLGDAFALRAGDRFVDVSAWQTPTDIDWPVLKLHGYKAAMIRLAAGTLTDPEWHLYAAGCRDAGLPWFGYTYFSFTVSWRSQVEALAGALGKMSRLPTVCVDLEGTNADKSDGELRAYVDALTAMGVPLATYTRQSWVIEHLPQAHAIMGGYPLIVANYKRPIDTTPALPPGWTQAAAWQHVSGEMVASWRFAKTISGKGLDESIVLAPGLTVRCGA